MIHTQTVDTPPIMGEIFLPIFPEKLFLWIQLFTLIHVFCLPRCSLSPLFVVPIRRPSSLVLGLPLAYSLPVSFLPPSFALPRVLSLLSFSRSLFSSFSDSDDANNIPVLFFLAGGCDSSRDLLYPIIGFFFTDDSAPFLRAFPSWRPRFVPPS